MRELGEVRRDVRIWWQSDPAPLSQGRRVWRKIESERAELLCSLRRTGQCHRGIPSWNLLRGDPCLLGRDLLYHGHHAKQLAWNSPRRAWPQPQCRPRFQNTRSSGWGPGGSSLPATAGFCLTFCNLWTVLDDRPQICHHTSDNGAEDERREKCV